MKKYTLSYQIWGIMNINRNLWKNISITSWFKKICTRISGSHVTIPTVPCYLNLNNTKFMTSYEEEGFLMIAIKSVHDLNHKNLSVKENVHKIWTDTG